MKVLLAHGSSDNRHGTQVSSLAEKVSVLLNEEVGCAFLSDGLLPNGATVLPLFLGAGEHVVKDIPKLSSDSNCTILPPVGEHADAIAELAVAHLTRDTRRINAMFVLYRVAGFESLTAALYAKAKACSRHALASLHSEPSVSSVLELWRSEGVGNISLQPMLLFEGRSLDSLRGMCEPFDISPAPVLSQCDGFAPLVANCFRHHDEAG